MYSVKKGVKGAIIFAKFISTCSFAQSGALINTSRRDCRRASKRTVSATWRSSSPMSPFMRLRFRRTYQFVSESTNCTNLGITVYSRYAAPRVQESWKRRLQRRGERECVCV